MPATDAGVAKSASAGPARVVLLAGQDDYDGWRDASRRLAGRGVAAESVSWQVAGDETQELFADPGAALPPEPPTPLRVPRAFPELAQTVMLHREPERFALLYELLVRLQDRPGLLDDHADRLVRRIELLAKAVRRDIHKMRAFVRFREIAEPDGVARFIAWFEPEHRIVRANAGFFVRRFAAMRWSILTPELAIHWDGSTLTESPGATREQAPGEDRLEEMWRAYYASIFNPARLKVAAMVKEMPRRYWKNLPEAQEIGPLIAAAQGRESAMVAQVVAPDQRPRTLAGLADEAQECRRCPLWQGTSGCVFGEGPGDARLMVVGEQPGDEEDKARRPFVGPAGRVFDQALERAGIDRGALYVTNAVKHFKYVMRGKRRLHQTPEAPEIEACRWWLDQETGLIRPRAILMMGGTAIRAVTGKAGAVGRMRGKPLRVEHGEAIATYHPSYVLRQPDAAVAQAAFTDLVEDLKLARAIADRG